MKEKIKIYTRLMKAQKAGNNDSGSRRKKLMRFFGASYLAIIMGAGVLCGTILAPLATHTNTSAGDDPSLTAQEQLLAGTLELDPENDPVICTIESGIEIKYAQVTINNNYYDANTAGQTTIPTALRGYAYLKLGDYNWIIIGHNTSSTTATVVWSGNFSLAFSTYLDNPTAYDSFAGLIETSSDAGAIISSAASNGIVWTDKALSVALDYSSATPSSPICNPGEMLVISQGNIGANTTFGGDGVYSSSNLLTVMRNLYYPETGKNEANFTESEKALIVPQKSITAETEYLFPLTTGDVNTYLNGKAGNGSTWWTRTQYYIKPSQLYIVRENGSTTNQPNSYSHGVRPAMVIKI